MRVRCNEKRRRQTETKKNYLPITWQMNSKISHTVYGFVISHHYAFLPLRTHTYVWIALTLQSKDVQLMDIWLSVTRSIVSKQLFFHHRLAPVSSLYRN